MAEALRGMEREAIRSAKQGSLAVNQEDRVRIVRDQAEGVHQAPQFRQKGVGRAVDTACDAPPGGAPCHTGGKGAVQPGAV